MEDIKIKPVLNGFIVEAGCQTLVFEKLANMVLALNEYYGAENPDRIEKAWLSNSINSNKIKSDELEYASCEGTLTVSSGGPLTGVSVV